MSPARRWTSRRRCIRSTRRSIGDAQLERRESELHPDCDLTNPLQNGECGPISDLQLRQEQPQSDAVRSRRADRLGQPRLQLAGATSALQHELRPGLAVNIGYFRTWYGNFNVTTNTALTPADFTAYCVTAPVDSRMPGGGGNQVCGNFDVNPAKFGVGADA